MFKTQTRLTLTLAIVLGSPFALADFDQAEKLYSEQQYEQAFSEYQKVANEGDSRAFGKLGALYLYGRGTEKDYALAYAWFALAHETGDKYAAGFRDAAASMLTPKQIYEAEKTASDLSEKLLPNTESAK